ncbi:MAG TPA: TRAP transporter large permease subunit [Nevskiaceae bacterium]|nr:TRAP transporter large permease subunit [Nevskiaceae bacterium]
MANDVSPQVADEHPANGAHEVAPRWYITIPIAILMVLTILFTTSSYIHAQLLHLGGEIWNQYNFLRVDMPKPTCSPNPNIDAEIAAAQKKAAAEAANPDSLFSSGPVNVPALRQSLESRRVSCVQSFKMYQYNKKETSSPVLRAYRAVELGVGALATFGQTGTVYLLMLIILVGGFAAKLTNEHISLRPPRSRLDHRFNSGSQFLANLLMTVASAQWWYHDATGTTMIQATPLHVIWVAGFGILTLLCAGQFLKPPKDAPRGGNITHACLTIPLYTWLAAIGGLYFVLKEHFVAEMIVQILRMIQFSDLYLAVALYIWAGILLKYTNLTEIVFEVLRPWKLAPELITIAIVLIAAVPTAYTGASGIFVLALGGTVYHEIRVAGGRRQLAMGAAAMSGSMGVVLSPCLMIVIIAALNRQVTTDVLFGWGDKIFVLSAALFIIVTLLNRRSPLTCAPPRDALGPSLKALLPIIPYIIIGAIIIFAYVFLFGQPFNEFSAPVVLPLILIGYVWYERFLLPRVSKTAKERFVAARKEGFRVTMRRSTFDAATPMGALLLLMAFAVVMGGAIERSDIMSLFPDHLGNIWVATAIMMVSLSIIGMIIDPYGAIILVSAVIAGIAYKNGITPTHFWMMTLVAFEVGYLMPPVMLNHLLSRLAIGEKEFEDLAHEPRERSFWRRNERILAPLAVMCSSLVIVSFAPLVYRAIVH